LRDTPTLYPPQVSETPPFGVGLRRLGLSRRGVFRPKRLIRSPCPCSRLYLLSMWPHRLLPGNPGSTRTYLPAAARAGGRPTRRAPPGGKPEAPATATEDAAKAGQVLQVRAGPICCLEMPRLLAVSDCRPIAVRFPAAKTTTELQPLRRK